MNTRQLISKSIDSLQIIFGSYMESVFEAMYGKDWECQMENMDYDMREKLGQNNSRKNHKFSKDLNFYLGLLMKYYPKFNFSNNYILTLTHYIKNIRNRWAHNYNFSERETYRIIDIFQSFLEEFSLDTSEIESTRLECLESLMAYEIKSKEQKNSKFQNDINKINHQKINTNFNLNQENRYNLSIDTGNQKIKYNHDLININKNYINHSGYSPNNLFKRNEENINTESKVYIDKSIKLSEFEDEMEEDKIYYSDEKKNNPFSNQDNLLNNNFTQSFVINGRQSNEYFMPISNNNSKLNFNYDFDSNSRKFN